MSEIMFSYYGSKSKIAQFYPEPAYDIIIEPFAGAGNYSLRYWNRIVILNENYELLYKIWDWLINVEEKDFTKIGKRQKKTKNNKFFAAERVLLGDN
jgi:site-specific DNA-adenine methylase